MTTDALKLDEKPVIDLHKLDRLMNLSGELVIIRSQYARAEKMLQHDLLRQKTLAQGVLRAKALLDLAVKEPARTAQVHADLDQVLKDLSVQVSFDQVVKNIQAIAHTTSALEKASSEIQSGVVEIRKDATGGREDGTSGMSIVPALLVVVSDEICAFPIAAVTEIVNVPNKDIYSVDGSATMKLRDHALSLVELSHVIQTEVANRRSADHVRRVVVITDGYDRLGIIVDSLLGKDDVVLKNLTGHFGGVKGITGAAILADDSIALILDPNAIIKSSR